MDGAATHCSDYYCIEEEIGKFILELWDIIDVSGLLLYWTLEYAVVYMEYPKGGTTSAETNGVAAPRGGGCDETIQRDRGCGPVQIRLRPSCLASPISGLNNVPTKGWCI